MRKRLLLWGLGRDFKKLWPYYRKEEKKGYITWTGGIDGKRTGWEKHFPVLPKAVLSSKQFDYLIISSTDYYWEIKQEAASMGVREEQIVDGRIFGVEDFDFRRFEEGKRLQEKVFDHRFADSSCANCARYYYGPGIEIAMGRRSYVANSFIEYDENVSAKIEIGQYSSISWDILLDMGLNMDHDYHRVTSYSITHLPPALQHFFHLGGDNILTPKIVIGSDVWIGKGCQVRSGVHISDGAVVAAHSYVVGDVPPYAIVGGNPARLIKYRFSADIIASMLQISWWEWPDENIHEAMAYFNDPAAFVRRYQNTAI